MAFLHAAQVLVAVGGAELLHQGGAVADVVGDQDDVRIVRHDLLHGVAGPGILGVGHDVLRAGQSEQAVDEGPRAGAVVAVLAEAQAEVHLQGLFAGGDLLQGRGLVGLHGFDHGRGVRAGDVGDELNARGDVVIGVHLAADHGDAGVLKGVDLLLGQIGAGKDDVRLGGDDRFHVGAGVIADDLQAGDLLGIVAGGVHADDLVAQAEREEDLGVRRGQGDDALRNAGDLDGAAEVIGDGEGFDGGRGLRERGQAEHQHQGQDE